MKLNAGCGEDVRLGWVNVDKDIPREIKGGIGWERVREGFWEGEHFDWDAEEGRECFLESYFRQVDLSERWPWEGGVFSKVLMVDVLEHFSEPLEVARNVYRVLKPGGSWVVELPHMLSHRAVSSWDHRSYWTRDKLRWLARSQSGHNAHAARDMDWTLAEFRWMWPSTLGGWLRGIPKMRVRFVKEEGGLDG